MKLNEIESILKHYQIEHYTIQPNGTVDVNGSVSLINCPMLKLPVTFGKVTGNFNCSGSLIDTLIGCPKYVGGRFCCFNCPNLTSLIGAPSCVGDSFDCSACSGLTTLTGAPSIIGGKFSCTWHGIKSGGIMLILTCCKRFSYPGTSEPFKIIEKYLGRPDDIFECQAELIEAGYAKFAEL